MKLEQDVCNGSKRKQIYKWGWLWQTGYYAKTKRKGGQDMREGWEYKKLGKIINVRTGKLDANASSEDGQYPFFTCSREPLRILSYSYDCECVLVAGNGDLNVKYYNGKFDAYQRTYIITLKEGITETSVPYLYKFFTSYIEVLRQRSIGGIIKYIKLGDITNAILPLPPLSMQETIVSELDKINELIRLKKEQLKDYDNLAQSIFYEMFGDPVVNEKGWEVKKLIETVVLECTISYGIVQPGDGVEDGIPVVRPIDLTGTFVSTNNLKKTTEKISSSYSRTILTGKELLVCVRGTTGVCSLVTDELKGCNVTRGITPLLFNDNTDRWFMYYQFQMPQIKCIIADYTKGITLKQINMADFRKIPVILPPLPLQQLFAQRIELIEKQKAEIQSTIADLETLLASRMQYWFD